MKQNSGRVQARSNGTVELEGTTHKARWSVAGEELVVSLHYGGERRVPIGKNENPERRAGIVLASMIEDELKERQDAVWRTAEATRAKRTASDKIGEGIVTIYAGGAGLTALAIFAGSWIYCIATYGYLLGVGLGWLPSIIVAGIAAFLWPLIALLALGIFALVFSAGG